MSVLQRVAVDRGSRCPPGSQLERQVAVMVREGRLAPGRSLPSTRRVARRLGMHRNTVAAAYRRLAGRGLLSVRHGARPRVTPADGRLTAAAGGAGPGAAPAGRLDRRSRRVVAAAAEAATARLMAEELRRELGDAAPVGTVVVEPEEATDLKRGPRSLPAGSLVVALPGPAFRWAAEAAPSGRIRALRARQDRRTAVRRALRRAPSLALVALASRSPPLEESVRVDRARCCGAGRLELRPAEDVPRDGDRGGFGGPPDVVIADRLARVALCETVEPVRVRLLAPETVVGVRRRLAPRPTGAPSATPRGSR